jgi:hypothetical protein
MSKKKQKPKFKKGDIARVARQPTNQFVNVVDEIVEIVEIRGGYGQVRSKGGGGEGTIPLDCLEPHTEVEAHGETCQRCGEVGADRRTLWMSCFYAMEETGLPFEQFQVKGTQHDYDGKETLPSLKIDVPKWKEKGTPFERPFYTLRVCKGCRATWMMAIKQWFEQGGNAELQDVAQSKVRPGMIQYKGRVPVRVFGATVCAPPPDDDQ